MNSKTIKRQYCACIRTIGKAGEKYQTLLDSLSQQTIPPNKILVYLPYNYPPLSETVGNETIVYVDKGMVHQRSVSYDEVDTEWVLLLDDDVYLPPDAMEKLFQGIETEKADFISPDTFHNHAQSKVKKLKAMATFVFPRRNDKWAFKLMKNTSFTYNNHPDNSKCYLTQSAAGPCMLVRKKALLSIHLQDEQWMDNLGYPLYEDMALVRKLSLGGYKCLVHYDSGVVHLDAGTSHAIDPDKHYLLSRTVTYVLWYRVFYNLKYSTALDRIHALLSYSCLQCWQFCFNAIPRVFKYHSFRSIYLFFKTFAEGNKIIKSEIFQKIPYYDEYSKVKKSEKKK